MSEQVWVVIGRIGEYSDRTEWVVAVLPTEAEGRRFVDLVSAQARNAKAAWDRWDEENDYVYGDPAPDEVKALLPLDPSAFAPGFEGGAPRINYGWGDPPTYELWDAPMLKGLKPDVMGDLVVDRVEQFGGLADEADK